MQLDFQPSKKIPRLLLAPAGYLKAMPVRAIWPDRSESIVYDLSLSGMLISPANYPSKMKLGQSFDFQLLIEGMEDMIPVQGRFVSQHSQDLGFLFESMSTEGRLILDQHTKDRLIQASLREFPKESIPAHLPGELWLHAAFDTNVLVQWKSADKSEIQRALVEYENLRWIYEDGDTQLHKSASASDLNQTYFQSKETARVSQGASWLDRLLKTLRQMDEKRGDLHSLIELLRKQRTQ